MSRARSVSTSGDEAGLQIPAKVNADFATPTSDLIIENTETKGADIAPWSGDRAQIAARSTCLGMALLSLRGQTCLDNHRGRAQHRVTRISRDPVREEIVSTSSNRWQG